MREFHRCNIGINFVRDRSPNGWFDGQRQNKLKQKIQNERVKEKILHANYKIIEKEFEQK